MTRLPDPARHATRRIVSRTRFRTAVTLLALAVSTLPALAHAILVASSPSAGGTVSSGSVTIECRFNSRVDHGRSTLRLIRPDKTETVLAIATDSAPDALKTAADLVPGPYVLRWQVLAIDGHITRGDVPFTAAAKP